MCSGLYGRRGEGSHPSVLAPMAGITDHPYRHLCWHFGADVLFTEMVSSQGLIRGNPNTWGLLRGIRESAEDVVVQLFGADPRIMGRAALRVAQHAPVRAVDINMGCPVRKVTKTGAGAALMRDASRAAAVVAAVREALGGCIPRPAVTVKMRAGWDEHTVNCAEVAVQAVRAGAETVAVHARTREMFYSGAANWDWIRAVKESTDVPVVGNGDVAGRADAEAMMARTGCDAVMVGRAAVGNPWIFRRLRAARDDPREHPPEPGERLDMALFHTELEVRLRGERRALPFMRHQLHRYVRGMRGAAGLRDAMNRCATLKELQCLLHGYAAKRGYSLDDSEVRRVDMTLPPSLRGS